MTLKTIKNIGSYWLVYDANL